MFNFLAKQLHKNEQIVDLSARLRKAEGERDRFQRQAKIMAAELSQLDPNITIEFDDEGNYKYFRKLDSTDARDLLLQGDHSQATKVQFRRIKGYFQAHQMAVSHILDLLDDLRVKNDFQPRDLDRIRDLRNQLSDEIGRNI